MLHGFLLRWLFLLVIVVLFLRWQFALPPNTKSFTERFARPQGVEALVIDVDFLEKFDSGRANLHDTENILASLSHAAIAVNSSSSSSSFAVHLNDSTKDYVMFIMPNNERRAILRYSTRTMPNAPGLLIPEDIKGFINAWNRSSFIDCLRIDMKRRSQGRTMPLEFVENIVKTRDFLVRHGTNPFIFEGTLLGWYRECSLIPSTYDADLAFFAEEHSEQLLQALHSQKELSLMRTLGRVNDSFEFAVSFGRLYIDVYYMYNEPASNLSYVTALAGTSREKFKYFYPRPHKICTGDLLGHLFWVPCNVEDILTMEYGEWRKDKPQSEYSFDSSPRNMKADGKWTAEEMNHVNCYFKGTKKKCGMGAHLI